MADIADGYLFGLRDIKLVSTDGLTVVDLPAAQELTWSENIVSAELKGDDVVVASVGFPESVEVNLAAGGISLEAYAFMTGDSATTTGSTPNRRTTFTRTAGKPFPYIQVWGRAVGAGNDSVWVKFPKVKFNGLEGNMQGEEFFVTNGTGIAVKDSNGYLYQIIKLETDAELS